MNNEKPLENLVCGYSNTSIFRKIAFIGDSLSSGEFETVDVNGNRGYHDLFEFSWGQYIARKNGLTAYNFSRGGMTAKWYLDSFAAENGFWDKDKACQAYVIALGANDLYHHNFKVGSINDVTSTACSEEQTFISYYAEIVRKYKEISPDAKFFFVSFPNETSGNLQIIEDMRTALYELSAHFENSYVIDLYKYGPIYNDEFKKKYFLHGHMNPMGYVFTAELIDSYIDYIIRTNPEDFKYVAFIGTDINYK